MQTDEAEAHTALGLDLIESGVSTLEVARGTLLQVEERHSTLARGHPRESAQYDAPEAAEVAAIASSSLAAMPSF